MFEADVLHFFTESEQEKSDQKPALCVKDYESESFILQNN